MFFIIKSQIGSLTLVIGLLSIFTTSVWLTMADMFGGKAASSIPSLLAS